MLPDGLERLEFLRTLDLSNNRLKEIPPGLGEMRSERGRKGERGEDLMTKKEEGGSDITFCLLLYLFFSDLSKLLLSENKLTTLPPCESEFIIIIIIIIII